MNQILVIRGGAIGDFVLTLPAIKLLRDAFPHAWLEILGYKHIAALAEKRFYAEAVRSVESGSLARFFAKDAVLPDELIGYFGGFDLVVSYLFDPDQIFEQNLGRCGVKNLLVGSPRIHDREHAAQQLARPLEELGLVLQDHAAKLFPTESDRECARRFCPDQATVAIHPGSGSVKKNWPIENWMTLLAEPSLAQRPLLIVGGEADGAQLATLRSVLPSSVGFAENLPLENLAAVLERCALFLGHDSGISHIAAAVGTRCILLYGEIDPAVWAPANPAVQVIRSPRGAMNDTSVASVRTAAQAAMS